MKFIPLLILLFSLLTNAGEKQQINNSYSFIKTTAKDGEEPSKLFIHTWKYKESDEFYNLSIEPGCILLKAQITEATKSTCTFKITGSYGGQVIIDMAKKQLGIKTETFLIHYHTKEIKVDGKIFGTSNIIQNIQDLEPNSTLKSE